jgi:DNA-directed RNA polymerase specialized sigma24 family protein
MKKKAIDESELLKVIDIISKKLAYKFKFGYHEIEDMKQQISIFALEGLQNYDHKRPLENFLWTHVRNRLFNYKRDNYQRPDKPCLSCPLYDPHLAKSYSGCSKYTDKNDCSEYVHWHSRNSTKKNLMHLSTIDELKDYGSAFTTQEDSLFSQISNGEIVNKIEENLNGENRITYLKLKNGGKVSKSDSEKLIAHIKNILEDNDG